jgi:hypothetical protein
MLYLLAFNAIFFLWGILSLVNGDFSVLTFLMVLVNGISLILNAERTLK